VERRERVGELFAGRPAAKRRVAGLASIVVLSCLLAAVAWALTPGSAAAHQGCCPPSTNANGNIVWKEYSKYDRAIIHGDNAWDNLGGKPGIWKSGTGSTLVFVDYNESGTSTVAYWTSTTGPDFISFNDYWMGSRYNDYLEDTTGAHEMGHAVGFNHPIPGPYPYGEDYLKASSIMWYAINEHVNAGGTKWPGSHDTYDYNLKY
jgi:hypothetical protein